jgi:ABC-type sugar transport system ATPase subunit
MRPHTASDSEIQQPLIDVRDVVKRFGGAAALDGASLQVMPGEVHALVGENGAGKSTLIKLLSGVYQPDGGDIRVNGQSETIADTRAAQALGIITIYQEHTLASDLSPIENIFLGREIKARASRRYGLMMNDSQMRSRAETLWAEFGGQKKDLLRPVSELGGLKQRLIEIIKALAFESSLIIMDEPTAQLPDDERDALLNHIRKMRDRGVAVLLVTHRLDEVLAVADRVTVFRDGKWIDTTDIAKTNITEIITKMVGREVGSIAAAAARQSDQPLDHDAPEAMRVEALSNAVLDNVGLTLRVGEVLGVGGLAGSGRTELARAIIGADAIDAGQIWIEGEKVTIRSPAQAVERGIFMVPEERKRLGIVAGLDVARNITISAPRKIAVSTFVQEALEKRIADDYVRQLRIKTSSSSESIENLSGGNQQKVLFARALFSDPKIIIVDEPTQGIDVGAKVEVYKLIREFVGKGRSVIVISSELPELLGLSDRVIVMREGRNVGEIAIPIGAAFRASTMEAMQRRVISLATGGNDGV